MRLVELAAGLCGCYRVALNSSLPTSSSISPRTGFSLAPGKKYRHSDMDNGGCQQEQKLDLLKNHINSYPDFPHKGIVFRDIFSVLNNPEAASALNDLIATHVKSLPLPIDGVLGIEARGFLFGPFIASILGTSFIPIRKKGKLPGQKVTMEYSLEYGKDVMEIQKDSVLGKKKVLIVDDLLATGGTMKAACDLAKLCNLEVVECLVIMELTGLKARSKLVAPCHSIVSYD